jgi:molybdopterin-guanine dinucleotide biosynthesis protein MobB
VAETRVLSVIGRKNAGKTTLLVALAAEYTRKGRRVMTIKQAPHPITVDQPGSDSYRHFHEGKAERTLLVTPDLRVSFERRTDTNDPLALARQYMTDADIVLVEGFDSAPLPKIEVFRREVGGTPSFKPDAPNAADWVAIVTDDDRYDAPCPVLRFRDTMWMQLLANLGWERAKLI